MMIVGALLSLAFFFWPGSMRQMFSRDNQPREGFFLESSRQPTDQAAYPSTQPAMKPPVQSEMKKSQEDKKKVSIYRLKIGQPKELQNQEMPIKPDRVYNLRTGRESSWEEMLADLSQVRLIYIGETHTSLPMHLVQARIIQELVERGYPVSVGVEMLPVTIQEKLTRWQLGILTEEEFLRDSDWYVNWSYNFGYYRPIFKLIKDYGLSLYGLNVPRDWITQLRKKGRDSLSEEQKKYIPPLDLSHKEHRLLIRAMFDSSGFSHQMKGAAMDKIFEGFYRAQVAWDETMAYQAWQALQKEMVRERCSPGTRASSAPEPATKENSRAAKLVVLAGSGHLLYNLGLNYRLSQRTSLSSRTVICLEVPPKKTQVMVTRTVADYVIGLNEEEKEAFPTIGLSLKKVAGLANLVVSRAPITGVAKEAGLKKGDIILEVDGRCFQDKHELYHYLAQKQYGDQVEMIVLREGERQTITLKF